MYENMNMMKKVLAVSSITVDSFGGDQSLRAWAKLNGFNFLMFNSVNAESERAMIAACEESALDVCKELFENVGSNKAILDCQNKQGETPMFMACKNGDLELCEWLHDHGDIELIIEGSNHSEKKMPIIGACMGGKLDVCKWLLLKVNGDTSMLQYEGSGGDPELDACLNGHLDIFKWILEQIDIDLIDIYGDQRVTPMQSACEGGHLKICEFLFEEVNSDPRIFKDTDAYGHSPMGLACKNGHLSVCEWLLDKGGQTLINGKDDGSELSPLHCASAAGQLEICKWLYSKGADIAKVNHGGHDETPMGLACENGHLSVCEWLLDLGGQKLIQDAALPIHLACEGGNLDVCKLVFRICGTKDVLTKDSWGLTAMHWAVRSGSLEVCKWLFDLIPDEDKLKIILTAGSYGRTPMYYAIESGHLEICKWLFDIVPEDHKHSTILTANNRGLTPMHIACQKGHLEICKWLLLNGALNTIVGNINLSAIRNFITEKASNAILNELRFDVRALKAFSLINRFFNNEVRQHKEETASASMALTQEGSDQEVTQTDIDIMDTPRTLESIPRAVLSQISDFVGDYYSESARDVLEALSIVRSINLIGEHSSDIDITYTQRSFLESRQMINIDELRALHARLIKNIKESIEHHTTQQAYHAKMLSEAKRIEKCLKL